MAMKFQQRCANKISRGTRKLFAIRMTQYNGKVKSKFLTINLFITTGRYQ